MDCNLKPGCTGKSACLAGALFFVFVFTAGESVAEAPQSAVSTAEIGVAAVRFHYTEFKDDGSTWDKERGNIPGLSFRFTQRISGWEWEGIAGYQYGRARYTGQTNSGVPYDTDTDEGVGDIALRLGRWFEGDYPVMPYAGLGYRRWDRDIRPASLAGLSESYRWQYLWLGAKLVAYQRSTSHLTLDIGRIRPIDPVLHVGAYNASLTPESRDGLRLMLTSHRSLSGGSTLILEPCFEYWALGRSPRVATGGLTVYEPASKTRNLGLNLRLGRKF